MRKIAMVSAVLGLITAATAAPADAQLGGRLSVEPYVAYGFFGDLPETSTTLESDIALGARVGYHLSPQWSLFANAQRSTPLAEGGFLGVGERDINVDHWSAGVEFSYIPRGGAEGMLPVLLEAGLGQARYENGPNDLAVNIGIASALRFSPRFAIRYGANDYISNFRDGNGVVNQIFVRVGGELNF